jgi:hypothetical protein
VIQLDTARGDHVHRARPVQRVIHAVEHHHLDAHRLRTPDLETVPVDRLTVAILPPVRERAMRAAFGYDAPVCGCAARDSALRCVRNRCASLMPALRAWVAVGIG